MSGRLRGLQKGCGRVREQGRDALGELNEVSSALLRISGVASRYVNARFQILGEVDLRRG